MYTFNYFSNIIIFDVIHGFVTANKRNLCTPTHEVATSLSKDFYSNDRVQ